MADTVTNDRPGWRNKDVQRKTLELVSEAKDEGITWAELSRTLKIHHGHSSSALSLLNKDNRIVRLDEQRAGNSIYVLSLYKNGRRVIPYGTPKTYDTVIANLVETLKYEGVPRSLLIDEFGYRLSLEYTPPS